ncbi:MAG: PAS domain-containing protein, partial [Bacteroidia bacterium]
MQHVLFNQEYTKQIINALPGIKLSYSFLLENLHQIDCSCSDFFDYSSDELKAGNPVPYYILRGFSSKDEHFNYYSKNLELNKIHISDYNIIGKNGIRKFFKEYACGEFDSNNQLTSYSCLVQEDVHRNNLSSIYKSLRSLQIAVNNASLIAITDINGKITYANELLCKASQYTIDELIGETHQVFRSDYHDKAFFVELWKTILQGKIWRGEICNKAKDGSLFWVDTIISPILNKEEFVEYFISTSNIITEKKLLEMSLLEKNEKYKSIFENANDIIMVIDESYRFSSINTSFEKLTSLKKINYLNKSIFEVIHPDDEIPLKR